MIELTEENFHTETSTGCVLVECYAQWCGVCKAIVPKVEEIEKANPNYKFCKMDVEKCPKIAESLGITNLPTFVLYSDGKLFGKGGFDILIKIEGAK